MITMTYKNNYRHIIYVKVSNELKNNTVHLKKYIYQIQID